MSRFDPPPHPLSIWIVNPFDDIPGEALPPLRFWTLCRVLAGRGHEVIWWSSTWSHRRKAVRKNPVGVMANEGFSVRLVPVRPYAKNVSWSRFRSHRDFGRALERMALEGVASGQLERPDIILSSLPPLEGPEAAAKLARRMDSQFVVDLMDLWPETFDRLIPGPRWLRPFLSRFFLGGMQRRRREIIRSADAISSATQTYADTVLNDMAPEDPAARGKPLHVCYLGAYLQEFLPPPRLPPADEIPSEPVAQKPLVCVYSGTLELSQDVDTAIAAAKRLSAAGTPAEIHIAGTGRMEASLRAAASSVTGSCRVIIHGLLHRSAYVELLSKCDVGLVLVKPESLVAVPYKACDFAAAGLALVNSLPGELAGLIDHYGAGVPYTCGDAASLASALTSLADDRRLLNDCRQASRRLAEAVFDREKTYPALAQWLEQLAH